MKIEIDENEQLLPGDEIELHYFTLGPTWFRATQLAIIEDRVNKDARFIMMSQEHIDNKFILQIRIIEPPPDAPPAVYQAGIGVTLALVLKVLAGFVFAGLIFLTFDRAYKIVKDVTSSPAGRLGLAGLGTMGIAAGVTALWALLSGRKK